MPPAISSNTSIKGNITDNLGVSALYYLALAIIKDRIETCKSNCQDVRDARMKEAIASYLDSIKDINVKKKLIDYLKSVAGNLSSYSDIRCWLNSIGLKIDEVVSQLKDLYKQLNEDIDIEKDDIQIAKEDRDDANSCYNTAQDAKANAESCEEKAKHASFFKKIGYGIAAGADWVAYGADMLAYEVCKAAADEDDKIVEDDHKTINKDRKKIKSLTDPVNHLADTMSSQVKQSQGLMIQADTGARRDYGDCIEEIKILLHQMK